MSVKCALTSYSSSSEKSLVSRERDREGFKRLTRHVYHRCVPRTGVGWNEVGGGGEVRPSVSSVLI